MDADDTDDWKTHALGTTPAFPDAARAETVSPLWPAHAEETPVVVYDIDTFHDLYDAALKATRMEDRAVRRQRFFAVPQVIRQTVTVPGDAAEIGCFRGLSAYLACSTYQAIGRQVAFHIFDSFQGLSLPGPRDASEYLPEPECGAPNPFACSEHAVRSHLSAFPFVEYHAGWIPSRFADVAGRRFAYVHIDVDLYEPTRDSVAFFWPLLSVGGAMLFDDYGTLFYPGARIAVREYFLERSDAFLLEAPSGAAVAVKLAL